jgi:uncharacterized protein YabE (DUF348 family)
LASEGIVLGRIRRVVPTGLQGLLAVTLVAGMLLMLVFGLMQNLLPVTLEVDGTPYQVRTHARTVGAALEHAGLDLYPEDIVWPALDSPLQPGSAIRVERARPVVLSADGRFLRIRTHATTVGEFLAEAGVETGPADEIWLDDQLVELETHLNTRIASSGREGQGQGLRPPVDGEVDDAPTVRLRRAASITLEDDGTTTTLHTTLTTLGQVLEEHGVSLFLGDEASPGLQEPIKSGMSVEIQRSVPVQIEADGRLFRTRTLAESVAGVLGQEGIALMGKDRVEPDLTSSVRPDLQISVTRVREEFDVEFEPIPFDTVWVADPEVEIDNIRLVQEGQVGLTKRRYRIVYENDREVKRFLEDIWAAQPPITKTMAYGTKIIVRTLDTPDGTIEYWRKMRVYTTSYTAASAGKPKTHPRYGYTRLGWFLTKGIVAVDPDVIPLRTKMYIPGYGIGRAGDTGGGVKGKLVDLGFDQHNYESWHWWSDVYILTPVPPRDEIRWVLPNWPRYPDRRQ